MEYNAKSRYNRLANHREDYLERGREASRYSLPYILPEAGSTSSRNFPTPFNSQVAQNINNLSSKLVMTLLPTTAPFYRLRMSDSVVDQAQQESVGAGLPPQSMKTAMDSAMSKVESKLYRGIEKRNVRSVLYEAVRHNIITGNAVLDLRNGKTKVHALDSYVVRRNGEDMVVELIIKEHIDYNDLPEDMKQHFGESQSLDRAVNDRNDDQLNLYTCCHYNIETNKYDVYQSVNDKFVEGSIGQYKIDELPFIVMRWHRVNGEHYGRGMCEEYLGDIISLEELTKAIVQGSAVAARTLYLVEPAGTTELSDLENAVNGDYVAGSVKDVNALQSQKQLDLGIAQQTAATISQSLNRAFLAMGSIQRQAERVTAREVSLMAQELESALGGVYTLFSEELQQPLVKFVYNEMRKSGTLPKLPEGSTEIDIITGVDALGRGMELQKLDSFIMTIPQPLIPAVAESLNVEEYVARRAAALGIDLNGLVKSQEQIQQEQQQAQQQAMQQQMLEKGIGPAVNAMSKATSEQNAAQAEEQ